MPTTPQISTSQALGSRSLLIMLITVQGTTPKYSSMAVQHCTALIATSVSFIQPSTTAPSLAIFISASSGIPPRRDIALDGGQLLLRGIVVVLHAVDAAQDLRQVDGLDRDAMLLQNFLAVAHRVERRRTRAEGADAHVAQALHHAADAREPLQVFAEDVGVRRFGVRRGNGVRDAVLLQVIAGGHLAAEAVAAELDGHLRRGVRRGLHQHGDIQIGQPQGIGDGALLAEIRAA